MVELFDVLLLHSSDVLQIDRYDNIVLPIDEFVSVVYHYPTAYKY